MRSTKLLSIVFSLVIFTGITSNSAAFAQTDDQSTLDSITDIEFRTMTDFHTYLPDTQLSFDVSCNELAEEFAIGFNTYLTKSNGNPADVNDVRNFVFLQRGSSDSGVFIDAVNTGSDRLKLTAEVTCAKLLPVPLPTVPDATDDFRVTTGDKVAKLIWKEPLFDGESPITAYQITAKPDPRNTALDVFAETVDTFHTFDGLVNGITYKFQVNAVNDVGPGILSEIITGTPNIPYVPAPTPIPTQTNEKTAVCHKDKTTLYLPENAVQTHLDKHGDYLGQCSSVTAPIPSTPITSVSYTPTTESTEKTALCHNEKTTLYLPAKAVRAHLDNHNDVLGECPDHTFLSEKQEAKKIQHEQDKAQRDAEKAEREAQRLADKEAKRLQQEQAKADKLAAQEAKKLQQQAKADKLAAQEAKKLQLEADKEAKLLQQQAKAEKLAAQEAKKLQLEQEKAQKEVDKLDKLNDKKVQKEPKKS